MPDIDKIIEQLLGDRRVSESATFSMRSYSDQPLIEKGSDLKARMERRAQERAARHEREARERRSKAQEREESRRRAPQNRSWEVIEGGKTTTERTHVAEEPAATPCERKTDKSQLYASILQGLDDLARSLDEEMEARSHGFLRREPLPEPIRQMRKLEGEGVPRTLAYGSSTATALFYRQAKLMEDYEDDYAYHGSFMQYYPTYSSMSDSQLRGYFTWRTQVRAGQMEPAPLSFAFLYAYELLMGVGTTAGRQGLADLKRFGKAYQQADEMQGMRLNSYLRLWLTDYAIYHDIPEGYRRKATSEQDTAVLTLFKAEHAYLTQNGRSPRIPNGAVQGTAPTDEQLFQALGAVSSYHICTSRLAKQEPELVQAVARDVFYALVMHCSKRRKTDYVEGLFGYASRTPYTMYSTAVFYESEPHPDCTVQVSDAEAYECKNGRWWHIRACESAGRDSELGLAMHAVDYELRTQLTYAYPLKRREAPKYLWKIVQDTVTRHLEQRAEAERRRITIDLSKLGEIRAAAAMTQEALLTDEERGDEPAGSVSLTGTSTAPAYVAEPQTLAEKTASQQMGDDSPHQTMKDVVPTHSWAQMHHEEEDQIEVEAETAPKEPITSEGDNRAEASKESDLQPRSATPPSAVITGSDTALVGMSASNIDSRASHEIGMSSITTGQSSQPETDSPLTAEEARLLIGLLDGTPAAELLGARAQFLSVVIDSINEKLFDVVGDTVIEFDGDSPCIVEDYLEDVREVLHS